MAALLERDGELTQLGAALERARGGRGGLVLLGGEAGAFRRSDGSYRFDNVFRYAIAVNP